MNQSQRIVVSPLGFGLAPVHGQNYPALIQVTLKAHQMFPVHTAPEEFRNSTTTTHFGFVFEENSAGKSYDDRVAIVFEELRFENVFRPHKNEKPAFSNASGMIWRAISKSYVFLTD